MQSLKPGMHYVDGIVDFAKATQESSFKIRALPMRVPYYAYVFDQKLMIYTGVLSNKCQTADRPSADVLPVSLLRQKVTLQSVLALVGTKPFSTVSIKVT